MSYDGRRPDRVPQYCFYPAISGEQFRWIVVRNGKYWVCGRTWTEDPNQAWRGITFSEAYAKAKRRGGVVTSLAQGQMFLAMPRRRRRVIR